MSGKHKDTPVAVLEFADRWCLHTAQDTFCKELEALILNENRKILQKLMKQTTGVQLPGNVGYDDMVFLDEIEELDALAYERLYKLGYNPEVKPNE